MRQILDDLLHEFDGSFENHKPDIVILAKAYFDVVQSKTSVLRHYAAHGKLFIVEPLSWYFRFIHDILLTFKHDEFGALLLPAEHVIDLTAFRILANLRMYKVYPRLPDMSYNFNGNIRDRSEGWMDYLQESFISRTDESNILVKGTDLQGTFLQYLRQELQPISSLLGISEVPIPPPRSMTSFHAPIQVDLSHDRTLLATRDEGPFRLLASFMEAIVEDEGKFGGLLMLVMSLKANATQAFDSSIVDKWIKAISPCLSNEGRIVPGSITRGSQFLLVIALLELLAWKRDPSSEPIPKDMIKNLLCILVMHVNQELPITMAERALEITPDPGSHVSQRVVMIYFRMNKLFEEARPGEQFVSL
ncbi:hypothetical protein C0995_013145 [Termitomyces sp. Mi166|nr:hypothetical protein C0995_013145 [Termitomyces sp. Mi166\